MKINESQVRKTIKENVKNVLKERELYSANCYIIPLFFQIRKNLLRFFDVVDGIYAIKVGDVDDVNITLHTIDIRTHVKFVREIQGAEFFGFSFEHN